MTKINDNIEMEKKHTLQLNDTYWLGENSIKYAIEEKSSAFPSLTIMPINALMKHAVKSSKASWREYLIEINPFLRHESRPD